MHNNAPTHPADHARAVAQRSTCPTRKAGAVLVATDGRMVTGYQGSPRGAPHCDVVGCTDLVTGECSTSISAELNVIVEAARRGVSTVGATCYVYVADDEDAADRLEAEAMLRHAGVVVIRYL